HYGDFTIPSITYSYFNTSIGKYEKLTTEEFHFHTRKGSEQNTGITVYGGVSKEDVKYLGKDIRFIKSDAGKLTKSANIILTKRSFYSAYAFALFVFLVILFFRREHIRRNSDMSLVRNRKAGKVAVKRLHSASVCLKNSQIDKFYEEILKAIWGYLSDKLNIPVSELTRNNAVTSLTERGIDEEKIKNLNRILDTCEYARFAPSAYGTEAATIYEGASQFIKSVENSIG
ncbi:MAG: BatD family protein, partial [Bacteroidetes bacterium]|nr:BatD family protein [Bacteroidota bacterium]